MGIFKVIFWLVLFAMYLYLAYRTTKYTESLKSGLKKILSGAAVIYKKGEVPKELVDIPSKIEEGEVYIEWADFINKYLSVISRISFILAFIAGLASFVSAVEVLL